MEIKPEQVRRGIPVPAHPRRPTKDPGLCSVCNPIAGAAARPRPASSILTLLSGFSPTAMVTALPAYCVGEYSLQYFLEGPERNCI